MFILEALEHYAETDRIAIRYHDEKVSFSALNRMADAFAAYLRRTLPSDGRPVMIYGHKQSAIPACMFGALKAGRGYIPVDTTYPTDRAAQILRDAQPSVLVDLRASGLSAEHTLCEEDLAQILAQPALPAPHSGWIRPEQTAYLLFTSGSTGTPKGIVIPHRAILDFTAWMTEFCGYTEDEIFGNQAPFYFDLSGKDVYQTLSLGASCRIFEKKYFTFPMLLLKAMEEAGVTAINWATSAFHLVAASGALTKYAPTHLKKAALGGEALQARYVNLWKAAVPGLQVVNMYGPTETTIDCAAMHLTREYRDDEPIPIGRACRNKQIILLKDDLTEAQPGEPGEICVRGSGVAAGYFADPAKTDAAFIQNPLCPDFRDILYRTGDMAVLREDGYLYFLARRDGQIKHMGYRIELGEIEVALHSLAGMQAAACLYDAARDRILCVYAGGMEPDALAKDLRKLLPKYMLPNLYEKLEALPYNANGKIDRVALKERYLHAEG